jgi:hypothetical protein
LEEGLAGDFAEDLAVEAGGGEAGGDDAEDVGLLGGHSPARGLVLLRR